MDKWSNKWSGTPAGRIDSRSLILPVSSPTGARNVKRYRRRAQQRRAGGEVGKMAEAEANHVTLQKGIALIPLEAYGAIVTCETGECERVIAHLKKGQVSGAEDL
jgi:hypothetical protein